MTTSQNLVDYPYAVLSPETARVADLRRIYVDAQNLNSQLSTHGSAVAAGSHKNVQWNFAFLVGIEQSCSKHFICSCTNRFLFFPYRKIFLEGNGRSAVVRRTQSCTWLENSSTVFSAVTPVIKLAIIIHFSQWLAVRNALTFGVHTSMHYIHPRTLNIVHFTDQYVLITRRSKLYFTASGFITPVGDRPVHRLREAEPTCAPDGHLRVWWNQMLYNIILTSSWWAHSARNM